MKKARNDMEKRICPECGKPLPEGCNYQKVFHDECAKKRNRIRKVCKERRCAVDQSTDMDVDRAYKKRIKKADKVWDRIAIATEILDTSYGKLVHEAFKRGIDLEQLLDKLGV